MATTLSRSRAGAWLPAVVLLAGCAAGETVALPSTPAGAGTTITAEITRPEGSGPFPAVVFLHSCAGVVRAARHVHDWTRRLLALGYVVAVPDSFSARGHPNGVCGYGMRVPPHLRAEDAYAVVRQLEGRTDVRPDRIGALGFSHGGWTVLAVMDGDAGARARAVAGAGHAFAAAIAFYPECAAGAWTGRYRAEAPLLILAGGRDDWTPAAPCQALAERARRAGQDVTIKIYAGAHHSFDAFVPVMRVPEALRGRGATIGDDNASREDSIKEVEAFFGRHLKGAAATKS